MTQDDPRTVPPESSANDMRTVRVEDDAPTPFETQPIEELTLTPGQGQQTVVLNQGTPALAWLVPLTGIRAGRLFPLDPRGTAVGRDAQNDIVLDDSAVSRQHAKLRRESGSRKSEQFHLYDLGSANGTFVNGKKIVRKALSDGDQIQIGETTLVFKTIESGVKPTKTKHTKRSARGKGARAKK